MIIHRTVNTSGVTHWRIKDENGKVVIDKPKRDELDRILVNFNIQIDNPIALLNQDTAKTFLFKCQPDKLYEFFMKATQLDECTRIYEESQMEIENAEQNLSKLTFSVGSGNRPGFGYPKCRGGFRQVCNT